MKIVILDAYTENPGDLSWEEFRKFGALDVYDRTDITDEEEIAKRIGNAEIVITNKTPISASTIEKCKNLKFIAVLATGYNVIDVAAAKQRSIPVSNVPAYGTNSVSQFSIALLLELCHHIGHHSDTVFNGKWQESADFCYWDYPLIELYGKTIGIVGFGRIGQAEGNIAKAMGMKVLAYDPYQSEAGKAIGEYVDLNTIYEKSDVISLHCNLTAENKGMINKESIAFMKKNVLIINNARGQLINEKDLADALNSDRIAGAALDVVSTEPIKSDNPLLKAKNIIITPHISWASFDSRKRIMDCTLENVEAFIDGNAKNVVNK